MNTVYKTYMREHDYAEREGKLEEITVTITLAEYRELIEGAAQHGYLMEQMQRENDEQRDRIALLSKALVHQCPEFFDRLCDIFKEALNMRKDGEQA